MRVSGEFLDGLDEWRRTQSDLPSRAEAIRRLVELGLAAAPKPPIKDPVKRAARTEKARKAAEAAIDHVLAGKPARVKAAAKRKLIKPPGKVQVKP